MSDTSTRQYHGAHPMIQPVRWSVPIEEALQQLPTPQRGLYRLLHDTALANTLRAPLLTHRRMVWQVDGHIIAAASLSVADPVGRQGYWRFRTDHPPLPWPARRTIIEVTSPYSDRWQLFKPTIVPAEGLTMAEYLDKIERSGTSTPSGVAALVEAVREPARGWVANPDRPGGRFHAKRRARIDLQHWTDAGLQVDRREQMELLDHVRHGALGITQAIHDAAQQFRMAPPHALAQQLDGLVRRWRGMSQHSQASERAAARVSPPSMSDLPSWINPDYVLPAGHPLQELRRRMEQELARQDPGWARRPAAEQRSTRRTWLENNAEQIATALASVDRGRFDVLRHWLVGGADLGS